MWVRAFSTYVEASLYDDNESGCLADALLDKEKDDFWKGFN